MFTQKSGLKKKNNQRPGKLLEMLPFTEPLNYYHLKAEISGCVIIKSERRGEQKKTKATAHQTDIDSLDEEFIVGPYRRFTADYSLTAFHRSARCVFLGHGGVLDVVPPHLRLLLVRGGEEEHRRGQGDQEGPQAAEEEGEEGD